MCLYSWKPVWTELNQAWTLVRAKEADRAQLYNSIKIVEGVSSFSCSLKMKGKAKEKF